MNYGVIRVTPHLIDDRMWPEIESELMKVFTEQGRSFDEYSGYWKIVGKSQFFDALTIEGTPIPCYMAIFQTVDDKPQFIGFKKE